MAQAVLEGCTRVAVATSTLTPCWEQFSSDEIVIRNLHPCLNAGRPDEDDNDGASASIWWLG